MQSIFSIISFHILIWHALFLLGAHADLEEKKVMTVEFFGESQCPFCRKFVREAWPEVWEDKELMEYIQYDFVAWGNAYFQTSACNKKGDSYDPDERACWYSQCMEDSAQEMNASIELEDDCFSGKVVYQHSEKEGKVDVFENCVKLHYGIEAAVDLTYCAEGNAMDESASASNLLSVCQGDYIDTTIIQDCLDTHGHIMEVLAAKATPSHSGVPYVLLDGEPVGNPLAIKEEICNRLIAHNLETDASDIKSTNYWYQIPKSCDDFYQSNTK